MGCLKRIKTIDTIDLSIIIVSFNSREVLMPCIESIFEAEPRISFEIIVVDNGSKDTSLEEVKLRFKEVNIKEVGCNLGYSGGNNIGFENSKGRYVLFLNPDTLIKKGALDQMVIIADSNLEYGLIGPKVLNKDGSLQRSCFRTPSLMQYLASTLRFHRIPFYIRIFGFPGFYPDGNNDNEKQVDAVSGCCLLIRRDITKRIGLFDTEYFMYFEEFDLCERVRQSGYKVIYSPKASITHLGGSSITQQEAWLWIEYERSRRKFFARYRSKIAEFAVRIILLFNSGLLVFSGIFGYLLNIGGLKKSHIKYRNAISMLCWQLGLKG